MNTARIIVADVLDGLRSLDAGSVRCCVTSPPYWGLRDYGTDGQLGLEPTPEEYAEKLVAVFREVRRVLADDGTAWINLGDTFWSVGGAGGTMSASGLVGGEKRQQPRPEAADPSKFGRWNRRTEWGCKPKDLVGIPWAVAFALRADGWWLRSDIIWSKPSPMPESVRDRPTKSHEYIFLLSKSARYFYNNIAIAEPVTNGDHPRDETPPASMVPSASTHNGLRSWWKKSGNKERKYRREFGGNPEHAGGQGFGFPWEGATRNKRSVWSIATKPFPEAHFATFPEALVEPCILAGSEVGDTVLDPFCGSGTTGVVALKNLRDFIGIELNPAYAEMAERRIGNVGPLLHTVTTEASA